MILSVPRLYNINHPIKKSVKTDNKNNLITKAGNNSRPNNYVLSETEN